MSVLLPESVQSSAILLAWPFPQSDWRNNYPAAQACYCRVLESFLRHLSNTDVVVLLHPSMNVSQWWEVVKASLYVSHFDNLHVINHIHYNDTWIRDYGPLSLSDGYFSFTFDGWGKKYPADLDNQVAEQLADHFCLPLVKSPVVVEGGALEINKAGVLLANRDCVVNEQRNPGKSLAEMESALQDNLGVKQFLWLEGISISGDDTDGHIDTLARFAEGNALVATASNKNHPDNAALQYLHQQLSDICQRESLQLHSLPAPAVRSQIDGRWLPATYANFLLANQYLFLPTYNVIEDAAAEKLLRRAFPSYTVVTIDCEALLEQHGSLHCATMQLAKL